MAGNKSQLDGILAIFSCNFASNYLYGRWRIVSTGQQIKSHLTSPDFYWIEQPLPTFSQERNATDGTSVCRSLGHATPRFAIIWVIENLTGDEKKSKKEKTDRWTAQTIWDETDRSGNSKPPLERNDATRLSWHCVRLGNRGVVVSKKKTAEVYLHIYFKLKSATSVRFFHSFLFLAQRIPIRFLFNQIGCKFQSTFENATLLHVSVSGKTSWTLSSWHLSIKHPHSQSFRL